MTATESVGQLWILAGPRSSPKSVDQMTVCYYPATILPLSCHRGRKRIQALVIFGNGFRFICYAQGTIDDLAVKNLTRSNQGRLNSMRHKLQKSGSQQRRQRQQKMSRRRWIDPGRRESSRNKPYYRIVKASVGETMSANMV